MTNLLLRYETYKARRELKAMRDRIATMRQTYDELDRISKLMLSREVA